MTLLPYNTLVLLFLCHLTTIEASQNCTAAMNDRNASYSNHSLTTNSVTCKKHNVPVYSPFIRVLLGFVLVIIILLSLIGNGFILSVVAIETRFRSLVNAFIVSQCIVDLGLSLTVMPVSLYGIIASDHQPFTKRLCRVQYYFNRLFSFLTVINLTAVAVDRYFIMIKPDVNSRLTFRTTISIIITMWAIVGICNVPWELIFAGTFDEICLTSRHYYCIITYEGMGTPTLAYAAARILLFGVIPCFIMMVSFIRIFNAVKVSRRRIGPAIIGDWRKIAVKVYARSACTTLLVIASFFVSILPHLIVTIVVMANPNVSPAVALVTKWLAWSDAVFKPLIYVIRSRKYSYEVKRYIVKTLKLRPAISRNSIKKYGTTAMKDRAARMSSYAIEVTSPVHIPTEREFTRLFTVPTQRHPETIPSWYKASPKQSIM